MNSEPKLSEHEQKIVDIMVDGAKELVLACLSEWPRPIPVSERLPLFGDGANSETSDKILLYFYDGGSPRGEHADLWTWGDAWLVLEGGEKKWHVDRYDYVVGDLLPLSMATHWLPLPPDPSTWTTIDDKS